MAMGTSGHPVAKRRGTRVWSIFGTLVRSPFARLLRLEVGYLDGAPQAGGTREVARTLVRELLTRERSGPARKLAFKETPGIDTAVAKLSEDFAMRVAPVAHGNDSWFENIVRCTRCWAACSSPSETTICRSLLCRRSASSHQS